MISKPVSITADNHPIGSGVVEKKKCACGGKGCNTHKNKADAEKGASPLARLLSFLKR